MENKRRMRDSEDAAELNRGVVATSSFRQMRGGGFFRTWVEDGIHCWFYYPLILFFNTIIRDERHLGVG